MNLPDTNKQEENVYQTLQELMSPTPTQSSGERRGYSQVKSSRYVKTETSAIVNIDMDTASNIEEIDAKIAENILKESDGTFSCLLCGKSGSKKKDNMKKHVETHLEGLSFPCQHCSKTFRSRNALHIHKNRQHRL